MTVTPGRVERLAQHAATVAKNPGAEGAVAGEDLVLPNIAEFVLDPKYLGTKVKHIYPRQLLVLKLIMGEIDLLTAYEHRVIDEWTSGFSVSEDGSRFEGGYGTTPDILERIASMQAAGRSHFREVVMILGRRAGKNWIGSIVAAYRVWGLLCTSDPQTHFGIDADMTLTLSVFAGQHQQALAGQWKNIADRICSAPCFEPYIAERKAGVLRLSTPAQLARGAREAGEAGLIEIVARESTLHGARGPSAFGLWFDEVAFAVNSGANRSADELFPAAVPSLLQCSPEEMIYESSSPWSKHGAFYNNYCRGLARRDGEAVHPEILVLQLPSWDLYEDFELTHDGLEAYPGGPLLPRIDDAGVTYEQLKPEEADDPEGFKVEYWAQWRDSPAAYLRADIVDAAFDPWRGRSLTHQVRGDRSTVYVAHLDPSKSGANTALVVGHKEKVDGEYHVIIDRISHWKPTEFDDNIIDYRTIINELKDLLGLFPMQSLTMDQYQSAVPIQDLRDYVRHNKLPRQTDVRERTATATLNRKQAELTKTLMSQGLIHIPDHEQARKELLALEDRNDKVQPPTAGPIQTDDICDALFNVVWSLIGQRDPSTMFDKAELHASQQGGWAEAFSRVGRPNRNFGHGTRRGDRRGPEGGGRFRR